MRIKTILSHLRSGRTATYTILRERGFTHGDAALVFTPDCVPLGERHLADRLRNFRFEERPYCKPRWKVT